MRSRILLLIAVTFAATSHVQAQGIAGKWSVSYDARVQRQGDGEEVVTGRGKAILVLQQTGDSVTGTWTPTDAPAGHPAVARQVWGTVSGKIVRFTTGPSEATVMMNGDSRTVQVTSNYLGTVDGDAIAGSVSATSADGAISTGIRKWDGTRVKS